jgi:nucleoside-diphosphate-sugar epimerase
MKRVAVLGASGLVGATLVERLHAGGRYEVVPVVHSSGNAWRVARLPLTLKTVDLMAAESVRGVVAGCSHVVNCTRGGDEVMLKGFRTLLDACAAARVQRLVHLSSVAVYGDPPAPDSQDEAGQTNPARGSYGWIKLQQDRMLERAARTGLSCVALCPPNIGGPYSYFLLALLLALRSGRAALVDGGRAPCNLVDVDNLALAIELALERGPEDGRRLFITDDDTATWSAVLAELRPLVPDGTPPVPSIEARVVQDLLVAQRPAPASLWRSLKHLVSSDVREVLRRDPLLARIDAGLRRAVALLGSATEERLRLAIEAPPGKRPAASRFDIDLRLTAQQLRTVVHSSRRAREALGYQPRHSFAASMQAFRAWYRSISGATSSFGDLFSRIQS